MISVLSKQSIIRVIVKFLKLVITGVANDKEKGRGVEGPEAAVIFLTSPMVLERLAV
jgi:hypothetical protein